MKMKLTSGLLGIAALLMANQASAATVSIQPPTQSGAIGDPISLTVQLDNFGASGVTTGSIAMSWDETVLQLETTQQDAQIDGIFNTGFTEVLRFDTSTAGQLLFTAAVGIIDPPQGVGNVAIEFLHLHFTALAPPGTNAGIGIGPDGNWQDGDFLDVLPADVTYVGASVTIGAVPVPPAVWLFGSGLLGLVGVARRRSPQLA